MIELIVVGAVCLFTGLGLGLFGRIKKSSCTVSARGVSAEIETSDNRRREDQSELEPTQSL